MEKKKVLIIAGFVISICLIGLSVYKIIETSNKVNSDKNGEVVNKMLPFMYAENRDNPVFTIKNFLLTLVKGIFHCVINFLLVIYSFQGDCLDEKGNIPELWVISVSLFTNILLIVSSDLLIYTKYHTWINFVIIGVVTGVAYVLFVIAVHNISFFNHFVL